MDKRLNRSPLISTAWALAPLVLAPAGCWDPSPGSTVEVPDPPLPPSEITQLVLLGTGTPNAEPGRFGSAVAVVVNGTPYLVDAGAGVVHRANQASLEGVEGLSPDRLEILFLTHLHTDHTVGLPDLMYTPWVLERDGPLQVFGPQGTEDMIHHLSQAYRQDVQVRTEGMEPANETGHGALASDIDAGVVYEDENVRVTAFPVAHGDWSIAYGYQIETPDRTIVISGDTGPTDAISRFCQGCDILVHEVYSQAGWDRRVPEWQQYHAAFHTSGPELGRIAATAEPRVLVLTHQLLWGATPEDLVAEVQREFSGQVVYGKDLDVF